MSFIGKDALLAKAGIETEDVEIPGKGTVQVRGLTRSEALGLQKLGELDALEMERKLVALAMVEPALTEDEVLTWQENSPAGELEPIAEAIQRLSGLVAKQVGAEMRRFR